MNDQTPPAARLGPDTLRSVELTRTGPMTLEARNARGAVLPVGSGDGAEFTPVELLLVALGGCGAIDLEHVTGKRVAPDRLDVRVEGHKIRDENGNHMVGLTVLLDVAFPQGEEGDRAREITPRAIRQVQDRLCTVGRTIQLGDPVVYRERA
ncbi:MAG: OsmC-like protein [Nocardioides sp.]|nr:OsmC-like protein [Nocardioides sp.]